jgi:Uncharacterised nucleotidyltransferase
MRRALRTHEEVVLLVAGTRDRRVARAQRTRRLLDQVNWHALLAELAYQGLVPLLGARVLEIGGSHAPAGFAEVVREQTESARQAGSLLELTTLRVATALEAGGVANVPLKGPLLARTLHGDPAMRHSSDIDVLVGRGDLARAAAALEPLGWHRADGSASDPVLHVPLVHDGGLPDVELHWRLHWYEAEFGAGALSRARIGSDGVRRLAPIDDLAALTLYHARDGFAGLRHPTDIAAWWDAHRHPAGALLLEPIARTYPGLERALTASSVVLQRLVGVPAAWLVAAPNKLPLGVRWAAALANPLMDGPQHQITAEVSLVDGLLAPRGQRVAFLRRRASPSAQELPCASAGRSVALARAEHSMRIVRRYVLAVLRSRPSVR